MIDRFACVKKVNKLGDCGVGRKEYIPQTLTWQCSMNVAANVIGKTKFG